MSNEYDAIIIGGGIIGSAIAYEMAKSGKNVLFCSCLLPTQRVGRSVTWLTVHWAFP